MNTAERLSGDAKNRVSFRAIPAGLRAHAEGIGSFAATVACWRAILVEIRKRRPTAVLLVDEMRGSALTAAEWQTLVQAMSGQGLEGVRIAHVKPYGLQNTEYCEIYAREAGFDARVFDNEATADLWVRYGSR